MSTITIPGYGDLLDIIAHYRAINILVVSAKENKDWRALAAWDKYRNMKPKEVTIKIKEK